MTSDTSRGALSVVQVDMEKLAQGIQILPEKTLREIAKGPLVKFTLSSDDVEKVRRISHSLIQTASTPSLSYQHTAAACNAVSAFVDAASNASDDGTKGVALASETWLAIFNIIVGRYEDAKPKPLRQLLASLTTILTKHYQGPQKKLIQAAVANSIFPSIILGEPRSRLKGSLVCLEHFIRKSAILPSELIALAQNWLAQNFNKWISVYGKDLEALSHDRDSPDPNSIVSPSGPSEEFAAKILTLGLLTQTNNREMAGTTGGILCALVMKMKAKFRTQTVSTIWVAPTRHMLLQNVENLEVLSSQILLPLFTADPAGFTYFIEALPLRSLIAGDMADAAESEYMLLFTSLQMGKKANLVHEDYDFSKPVEAKDDFAQTLVLKSEVIGNFLLHREPSIRIAALSLLVTTFATAKPLATAATSAILRGLPSMHADSDSYTRGEILSLTRKLIVRLKSGVVKLEDLTNSAAAKQSLSLTKSDTEKNAFLQAYIRFLQRDLAVTASYPRHITALKALKLLLQSGLDQRAQIAPLKSEMETRWKSHMNVFEPRLLRLLVDLLLDPFEDVRQSSLSIINLFPHQILLGGLVDASENQALRGIRLTDTLARAERLASNTSRADHADTVARLYHILFCAASNAPDAGREWWATKPAVVNTILSKLEDRVSSSEGLFNSSLKDAPLHGYMSGLRYIVLMTDFYRHVSGGQGSTTWRSVHNRIVSICNKVWHGVKPVLCIDSPEGHSDDPIEDLSVGPKDILSYSWRALRESSLLLYATMFNLTYGPNGADGLKCSDFEAVGKTSFTQLAELRHRGAFSTVSQTFAICCERCSSSKDPAIKALPKVWYQEAKATIFESASKLTRRSAGLPALVTGILVSDPGTPFFKQALNELHHIARLPVEYDRERQYLELPQVHAMNCLKDIFTNTKLGPYTEPFIMPALTLSAERLGSPIWALRNSGLMLFRALLIRMCRLVPGSGSGFGGSSGSEPGSKVSFPKYPGLLELLSKLLSSSGGTAVEGSDIVTERIFPALELIGEKIPTYNDNNDALLCDLVLEHLKSPIWGIREHAARVYASLLTRANILSDVRQLVNVLHGNATENYIHGTALCIRYSFRRFAATTNVFWTSQLDDLKATLRHVLAAVFPISKSPYAAAVLIEILNDTLGRSFKAGIEDQVALFVNEIFEDHDLEGVFGYVFDASHAGWNLSSRTRAFPLLRRAMAWCMTLKMLALRQPNHLQTLYRAVALFDADAATWIAEHLEGFAHNESYKKLLADLYSSALLGDHPVSTKTATASNLASILEEQLHLQDSSASKMELPWIELRKSFRPEADIQEWNRHATDAALRLQGCLLAVSVSANQGQPLSLFQSDIQSWVVKLRSALSEETEFTTRHAAVASLHSFSRGLRASGNSSRTEADLLDVYLILYDMLNDDDEELRDIAASTTSWVLSYSSVSPSTAVALGPLNGSALLASFIIEHYSGSAQLAKRVVRYLTGLEPRISGSDYNSSLMAVSGLVKAYSQESTVLFVEEKQNLFIDEVREVDVWISALAHLKRDAYSQGLVQQVSSWVFDGLEHLIEYLGSNAGKDGLLGWTSKPESFTLNVRLISIASALASPRFGASDDLAVDPRTLQEQLQTLLDTGRSASMHDELLSRIQSGLDFGVLQT